MYAFPSQSIVPGPRAASSRADRVPTTDVSTRLQHSTLQLSIRASAVRIAAPLVSQSAHAGEVTFFPHLGVCQCWGGLLLDQKMQMYSIKSQCLQLSNTRRSKRSTAGMSHFSDGI